jgi:hypothetical protein
MFTEKLFTFNLPNITVILRKNIPFKITEIFGKKVGFLGLGPGPTGHLRKKKKF